MRKNPWEAEPQYIATVNKTIAARFKEIGITDEHRRGWQFETEVLEGTMVLVAMTGVCDDGWTYENIFKPEEKLATFLQDAAAFKAYMERTKGGTII